MVGDAFDGVIGGAIGGTVGTTVDAIGACDTVDFREGSKSIEGGGRRSSVGGGGG